MDVLRTTVILALTCAACGDALVPSTYRGRAQYTFTGVITDLRYSTAPNVPLTASLFWSRDGTLDIAASNLAEQRSVEVQVRFPATFQINVFDPPTFPGSEVMVDYRAGLILVYEDSNGSGDLDPGEIRGGAPNHALVYAYRQLDADSSPTGRPLAPGFSLLSLPLPCEGVAQRTGTDPNNCGVALGAACTQRAACGPLGECLQGSFAEFPGGYCMLPVSATSCTPAGGVPLQYGDATPGSPNLAEAWIQGCDSDDECRPGYGCPAWIGACLPEAPVYLDISPAYAPLPLCQTEP